MGTLHPGLRGGAAVPGAGILARALAAAYNRAQHLAVSELPAMDTPPTVTTPGVSPSPASIQVGPWVTNGASYYRVRGLTSLDFWRQNGSHLLGRGARTQTVNNSVATGGFVVEFVTDSPNFLIEVTGTVSTVGTNIQFAVGNPDFTDMSLAFAGGVSRASFNNSISLTWAGVRRPRGYRFFFTSDQGIGRITLGAGDSMYAPENTRPRVLDIGDSFIASTMSPSFQDGLLALPNSLREVSNWEIIAQGIGSSGYINGIAFSAANLFRFEDAAAANADLIRVWLGGNDTAAGGPAIQAAATASLALLRQYCPNVPIIVFGPNAGTANLAAAHLAAEAAIEAAVAAQGDLRMVFVPTCRASTTTTPEMAGDGRTIYFTAALDAATSGTLAQNWIGTTLSRTILFSDGSTRTALLTNGSASVSWTGAVTATATAYAYTAAGASMVAIGPGGAHPTPPGALYIARWRTDRTLRAVQAAGW